MNVKTASKTKRKPASKKTAKARRSAQTRSTRGARGSHKRAGRSVAIVGGGISGLTAAIKLLKAGFDVTIFEKQERLGGNTSSTEADGVEHDVYPHMFCDWYDNFWDLFENDLGLDRAKHFDPRAGVKMLREGSRRYDELLNPTTIDAIIRNLKSGALPPAEMLLMGYSMVDLAGYPFNRKGFSQLDKQSVNGFLYSTSYATEDVAELENYMLQVIWSIQAQDTSATTYQDFVRHTLSFPNGAPFAHMLKSSLNDGLIEPIRRLLEKLGGDIKVSTEIEAVRLTDDGSTLHWKSCTGRAHSMSADFDSVILAVPGAALTDLVMGGNGRYAGDRIIDREPSLSQVRRLSSVAIPVIDLYLNKRLADFPAENIGLTNAKYGLSVVDIAQLWTGQDFGGNTALVIAASDGASLPGHDFAAQAWYMLQELSRFYPEIDIGKRWGDPDSDVDWGKSFARSNTDYTLFLNDVGSWDWRPETAYPGSLPGLFFAGDLCRGNVDMATVEGAVESGVLAAAAVQQHDASIHGGTLRGKPVELIKHVTYGDTALRAAKIALMPFAYAAKGWTLVDGNSPETGAKRLGNALQSEHLALLPMQFAVDWWTTAFWFWHSVFSKDEGDQPLGPSNHDDDDFIGLGAAVLMVLGEVASYATEQCETRGTRRERSVGDAAGDASSFARNAGRAVADLLSGAGRPGDDTSAPHKRRWHPKR